MYKYVRIRDICLLGLLQTLSVELLNERKDSAILDDLNRFQEVHKQPQDLNICSYMHIPDPPGTALLDRGQGTHAFAHE